MKLHALIVLQETYTYLRGLKVAWVGDGNNIVHSLMMACPKMLMDLRVATPAGYECDTKVVEDAVKFAAKVRHFNLNAGESGDESAWPLCDLSAEAPHCRNELCAALSRNS